MYLLKNTTASSLEPAVMPGMPGMLVQDIMDMLSRMMNMYQMPCSSRKTASTRAALRPAHQAATGPQPSPIRRMFPLRLPKGPFSLRSGLSDSASQIRPLRFGISDPAPIRLLLSDGML